MRRQPLIHWVVCAIIGALLLAVPAYADDASDRVRLDELFRQLSEAPDEPTARRTSAQIWEIWLNPSDPALRDRMDAVAIRRQTGDLRGAIGLLDRLVADFPSYAEGWNQRATLHYVMGNLQASLDDIDEVLALEPRHFGALSGRVLIRLQQGERALALRDMRAALAIHPFLGERQFFPELEQDDITRI